MHLENGDLSLEYLQEFVDRAAAMRVDEIGITEHAYNFVEAAPLLNRPAYVAERSSGFRLDDYVHLIQTAQRNGLPVKLGLEMDWIAEREDDIRALLASYPWDYVIGSVHWIDDWGFDLHPASWENRDVVDAYRRYFDLAEQAIASGLFDIFGHPDVIKVFGYKPPVTFEIELLGWYDRLVAAAKRAGCCFEVSSAGLRKPVGEFYPDMRLLRKAYAQQVPITLASDAHVPEHVGWRFDELAAYAREAGYRTITQFTKRVAAQQPLG